MEMYQNQQRTTSADTSINVLNKVYTGYNFEYGSKILDYGGGKFDRNKEYMTEKGCMLEVYDPFNRSKIHNTDVVNWAMSNQGVDYVVCSNVLNVIDNIRDMLVILDNISKVLEYSTEQQHRKTKAIFTIYECNKNSIPKYTSKGFQRNEPLNFYIPYIERYFKIISKKNGIVVCELKN